MTDKSMRIEDARNKEGNLTVANINQLKKENNIEQKDIKPEIASKINKEGSGSNIYRLT